MIEILTDNALSTLKFARRISKHRNAESVDAADVFVGLLAQQGCLAARALQKTANGNVPMAAAFSHISAALGSKTTFPNYNQLGPSMTWSIDDLMKRAFSESKALGHSHTGTEHLLLAMYELPTQHPTRQLLQPRAEVVREIRNLSDADEVRNRNKALRRRLRFERIIRRWLGRKPH